MRQAAYESQLRLKRRCLGLCASPRGEVYLADIEARPHRVYVMSREEFRQTIASRRIRARHWCLVMPRSDCLVKQISLPAADEVEAAQMLAYELPGLVPVQNENICHGIMRVRSTDANLTRYAVFLSPQTRVTKASSLLIEAGITPSAVIPDSVALWRWREPAGDGSQSALWAAVDLHECCTIAVDQGELAGGRSIPLGEEPSANAATLLEEVRKFWAVPESQQQPSSGRRIVLAGRRELCEALARQIESALHATGRDGVHCEVHAEMPDLRVRGVPAEDVSEVAALCALGCALEHTAAADKAVNLAPADWHEKRRTRERWRERMITAGMVAVVPLLAYGWLAVQIRSLERQRAGLEAQIAPIREIATALELKRTRSKLIQSQISDRTLPLEALADLYRLVPEGLSLSQLELVLDPTDLRASLKGSAATLESAFAFPNVLEESSLFADVRPEGAQQVSRGGGVLIEFGCRCRIDAPAVRKPV